MHIFFINGTNEISFNYALTLHETQLIHASLHSYLNFEYILGLPHNGSTECFPLEEAFFLYGEVT